MNPTDKDQLVTLMESWTQRARRKFVDAENETDPMGRRLIENGAMIYFTCAEELRIALAASKS